MPFVGFERKKVQKLKIILWGVLLMSLALPATHHLGRNSY
jgi:hypothetical protein